MQRDYNRAMDDNTYLQDKLRKKEATINELEKLLLEKSLSNALIVEKTEKNVWKSLYESEREKN